MASHTLTKRRFWPIFFKILSTSFNAKYLSLDQGVFFINFNYIWSKTFNRYFDRLLFVAFKAQREISHTIRTETIRETQ